MFILTLLLKKNRLFVDSAITVNDFEGPLGMFHFSWVKIRVSEISIKTIEDWEVVNIARH